MNLENCSAKELYSKIEELGLKNINIMEVCGTHTMAIAKAGIRQSLLPSVNLISGPGCPVCVTPAEVVDSCIELSQRKNIIIATYGDMLKVPGSNFGECLAYKKACGAKIITVFSPMDALDLALQSPGKEVVFLGVGFETTAPGTAQAIKLAREREINNFSVLSMLKTIEPALRALIKEESFNISGFLCPGHVASIIGESGFSYLAYEYKIPCVIGGFSPQQILTAIYMLLLQIKNKMPLLENAYKSAVRPEGNLLAKKVMEEVFEPRAALWRGLSSLENSGLAIKDEYSYWDAEKKFNIKYKKVTTKDNCHCGDVICGRIKPADCRLFGKNCKPESPVGPCMVSGEGACAAAYKYMDF